MMLGGWVCSSVLPNLQWRWGHLTIDCPYKYFGTNLVHVCTFGNMWFPRLIYWDMEDCFSSWRVLRVNNMKIKRENLILSFHICDPLFLKWEYFKVQFFLIAIVFQISKFLFFFSIYIYTFFCNLFANCVKWHHGQVFPLR